MVESSWSPNRSRRPVWTTLVVSNLEQECVATVMVCLGNIEMPV